MRKEKILNEALIEEMRIWAIGMIDQSDGDDRIRYKVLYAMLGELYNLRKMVIKIGGYYKVIDRGGGIYRIQDKNGIEIGVCEATKQALNDKISELYLMEDENAIPDQENG